MHYWLAIFASFFLSLVLTYIVKILASKWQVVDVPNSPRKIHSKPIPLLGGVAVFLSFVLVLIYYSFFTDFVIHDFIAAKYIYAIVAAGLIIIIGGIFDDKYNLKPSQQIPFVLLAVIIIVVSGIGIGHVRNPFGGTIPLNNWDLVLFHFQGLPYKITLLADLFTFIWLLGMMYTTKLLDGLDGLVSGVSVIGCLIIFGIAMSKNVSQDNTALIALILAGSFLGFLVWNWNPAKIFLGEGGSLFAGLMLGILAIISGSKVATALLIMGIPILDVAWVIIRRVFYHKNVSQADKKHLHFRLLEVGLSQRQAVLVLYFLTALFGSLSLFLQTYGKLIAFIILLIVMVILASGLVWLHNLKNKQISNDSRQQQ